MKDANNMAAEKAFKEAKEKALANLKLVQKRIEEMEFQGNWMGIGDLNHIATKMEEISVHN